MADQFTARKLKLLDRANVDLRLTDQDYRVLSYISSAVDRETELARRKQQVISTALGKKSVRGVQISLNHLHEFGYLKFETGRRNLRQRLPSDVGKGEPRFVIFNYKHERGFAFPK
jgi:hypothetical protein